MCQEVVETAEELSCYSVLIAVSSYDVPTAACQQQVVLTSTNETVSEKKRGKYLEQIFLLSFAIK